MTITKVVVEVVNNSSTSSSTTSRTSSSIIIVRKVKEKIKNKNEELVLPKLVLPKLDLVLPKVVSTTTHRKVELVLPNYIPSISIEDMRSYKDNYTKNILLDRYNSLKQYVGTIKKYNNEGVKIRVPVFPEDISENIVKFILHGLGDTSSRWNCEVGDLYSDIEGVQECKCFTTDAPISFSPTSTWDTLYLLDARDAFSNDHFILYRIKKNDKWNSVMMNSYESFMDQCLQKRRPRINWSKLFPQVSSFCEKLFDGNINEI